MLLHRRWCHGLWCRGLCLTHGGLWKIHTAHRLHFASKWYHVFLCQDTLSLRISVYGFRMHLWGPRKRFLLQIPVLAWRKCWCLWCHFWDSKALHSHSRLEREQNAYFPVSFSSLQLHEFQGGEEEEERQVGGRMGRWPTFIYLTLLSIYFNWFFVVQCIKVGQIEGLFIFRLEHSIICSQLLTGVSRSFSFVKQIKNW